MRLRNTLKICLVFWKSEPRYVYKRYAYKKTCSCEDYPRFQKQIPTSPYSELHDIYLFLFMH